MSSFSTDDASAEMQFGEGGDASVPEVGAPPQPQPRRVGTAP